MLNWAAEAQDQIYAQAQAIEASMNGQFCTVYRLMQRTSVSVLKQPVLNAFPSQFALATRAQIESLTFDLKVFVGTCDFTMLQFGDILVDNCSGDRYCFAQRRLLKEALFARVERTATITRPNSEINDDPPGSTEPQETGWVWSQTSTQGQSDYAGRTAATDAILSLQTGTYSFGTGTPAQVPVGLQPIARVSDVTGKDFAENLGRTRFLLYIPPLPGVELQRLDRVDLGDMSCQIAMIYNSQAGFFGSICVVSEDAPE